MKCRHCSSSDFVPFIDLGVQPPSNAYLSNENAPEIRFPLQVLTCTCCWLTQTRDFVGRESLFTPDYAYLSSVSLSWVKHCADFVDAATRRFNLRGDSMVGEIASNDGYLLQHVAAKKIPCFGVEPTTLAAGIARAKGLYVIEEFFGRALAQRLIDTGYAADLLIANNVLAHVPDVNDFVGGMRTLLKPHGVATFEFPYLGELVSKRQFDTIYHEHYSYFSLSAAARIFESQDLEIFDVEWLGTHGGSLRVYAQRRDVGQYPRHASVEQLLTRERTEGMETAGYYTSLQKGAEMVRAQMLSFLEKAASSAAPIVAYGAAAKGNTLLNFAGIQSDTIPYVVDRNPNKIGKFLPGSRIPIVSEDHLRSHRPSWVLILPWNLADEIASQLAYVRAWNCGLVTMIPELKIL